MVTICLAGIKTLPPFFWESLFQSSEGNEAVSLIPGLWGRHSPVGLPGLLSASRTDKGPRVDI